MRCYPDVPRAEGYYVAAEPIESYVAGLRQRYPAPVTAEVAYSTGGRIYRAPRHGPEILHHGAFFEPSRQRLARLELVLLDVPSTSERVDPAAAALMQQVTSRALIHDGNAELARQMIRVPARATPKGWAISSATGETVVAAPGGNAGRPAGLYRAPPPSRQLRGL